MSDQDPPADRLARYRSNKHVRAGEIVRCDAGGCEVRNADGSASYRRYTPSMLARLKPQPGDWWIVYEDGFQAIWPAVLFEASGGFEPEPPTPPR